MKVSYYAQLAMAHNNKWKIGFTNGCFDLLHEGHRALLKEAKSRCQLLVVGINDDESVRRLKGDGRPVQSLKDRVKALENSDLVDVIWPFHTESELFQIIADVKPDFLFKGMDYYDKPITGGSFLKKNGRKIVLLPLVEGYSTTRTIAIGGTAC